LNEQIEECDNPETQQGCGAEYDECPVPRLQPPVQQLDEPRTCGTK